MHQQQPPLKNTLVLVSGFCNREQKRMFLILFVQQGAVHFVYKTVHSLIFFNFIYIFLVERLEVDYRIIKTMQ